MFKKKVGEEEAGVVEEGVGDAVVEDEEEGAEVGHEYELNNTGCACCWSKSQFIDEKTHQFEIGTENRLV